MNRCNTNPNTCHKTTFVEIPHQTIPCKLGLACSDRMCPLAHYPIVATVSSLAARNDMSQPKYVDSAKDFKKMNLQNPPKIPCKFGKNCYNNACRYDHPEHKGTKNVRNRADDHSRQSTIPCRYGADCKNTTCKFDHPKKSTLINPTQNDDIDTSQISSIFTNVLTGVLTNIASNFITPYMQLSGPQKAPCRFGSKCTNARCEFRHN